MSWAEEYKARIDAVMAEAEASLGEPLTERERKEFESYTASSIVGVKRIRAMSNDELKTALTDKTAGETLRRLVGANTNPSWVVSIVAETLYMRHEIDETKLDYLMEHGYLGEVKIDL
jgi:hypothetical protein